MAMNKRKKTTAIVAGVTAAALLLGGTFAWTSISQQAKNEAIVDINPGGRLHDDFDGKNKDVYVENFSSGATGVNIFARIRLDQYFEVGQDAGINKEVADRKVTKPLGEDTDINNVETWVTYTPGDTLDAPVQANDNWQWTLGNEDDNLPYYMPTFNKNKDSLAADINGTYEGKVEGDIVHYDDFVKYGINTDANEVASLTQDAIYDWDEDTDEDYDSETRNENDPIDSADVLKKEETHNATPISTTATVITMAEWLALPTEDQTGNFWVYDTDGWAYWAQPIEPGKTTGLLLDSINMSRVPDDNWYYGINVVGQFATASDWEMFFVPEEENGGGTMTDGAKQLMGLITGTAASDDTLQVLELTTAGDTYVDIQSGESVKVVSYDDNADMTSVKVGYYDGVNEEGGTANYYELTEDQYTYDAETSVLTILDDTLASSFYVTDATGNVSGYVNIETEVDGDRLSIGYTSNAADYDIISRGYIAPGETLHLTASLDGDNALQNDDCTWTATCDEGHPCGIDNGVLTITKLEDGVTNPHLITVTCSYKDEAQGLDLTAEFNIVISEEALGVEVTADPDTTNATTGTLYTMSATLKTESGTEVTLHKPIEWSYSITDENGGYIAEVDGAELSGNQFMAFKPGTYYVDASNDNYHIYGGTPLKIVVTGDELSPYIVKIVTNAETGEYGDVTAGVTDQPITVFTRFDGIESAFDKITSAIEGITVTYVEEDNIWTITVDNTVAAGRYTLTYTIHADEEAGTEEETGTIDLVIVEAE